MFCTSHSWSHRRLESSTSSQPKNRFGPTPLSLQTHQKFLSSYLPRSWTVDETNHHNYKWENRIRSALLLSESVVWMLHVSQAEIISRLLCSGRNPSHHKNESAHKSRRRLCRGKHLMLTIKRTLMDCKCNKWTSPCWSTAQHGDVGNKARLRFKSGRVQVATRQLLGFMMNECGPTISQSHHNSVLTVKCQAVTTHIRA